MKHARDDYNRIQDPAGLIPEDEPVFLLRAQDKFAVAALRYYAHLVRNSQNPDERIIIATEMQVTRMREWPKRKAPDMPARSPQVSATEADRG